MKQTMLFDLLADNFDNKKLKFINKFFTMADLWCGVDVNNYVKVWILQVTDAKELEIYKKYMPKIFKIWDFICTSENNEKNWMYIRDWEDVYIHTIKNKH